MGTESTDFELVRMPIDRGLNTSSYPHLMADGELEIAMNCYYDSVLSREIICRPSTFTVASASQRVTSLFSFVDTAGDEHLFGTWGTRAYSIASGTSTKLNVEVDGFLANNSNSIFTSDKLWQWVEFEGTAYAATQEYHTRTNGTHGKYIPAMVKYDLASNRLQAFIPSTINSGTNYGVKHLCVWNRRIFAIARGDIVGAPDRIVYSPLGSIGTIGSAVNGDGDTITNVASTWGTISLSKRDSPCTGLAVIDDALVMFFRNRIMYIEPGDPSTDATLWNVRTFVEDDLAGVGCISGYSIKQYENSLIFLSDRGVYALTGSGATESSRFKLTYLQENRIYDSVWGGNDEYPAMVRRHYYIVSYATGNLTPHINDRCYAYDLRGKRWLQWDGVWIASCYAANLSNSNNGVLVNGQFFREIVIGNYDGIYGTGGTTGYDKSGTVPIVMKLRTKAYDLGNPFIQKLFNYIKLQMIAFQNSAITLTYIFDNNLSKSVSESLTYTYGGAYGGVWGQNWGSMIWADNAVELWEVNRKMENATIGRSAKYIQVQLDLSGQDLPIVGIAAEIKALTKRNTAVY